MGHFTRILVLSLSLLALPGASYALEEKEIGRYTLESSQLRRDQTLKLKEAHLKHINELYEMKLKHLAEIDELIKELKAGDKDQNKAVLKRIKERRKDQRAKEKEFRQTFREDVLKPMTSEFKQSHKQRQKRLKVKGRLKNSQDSE